MSHFPLMAVHAVLHVLLKNEGDIGRFCALLESFPSVRAVVHAASGLDGRLIDADEIHFESREFDTYEDYSRAFDAIDYAETIVEADKEDKE